MDAAEVRAAKSEVELRFASALHTGSSPLRDRTLAPLIRASPLLFAQLCLKGPPQPPFYGRLLFSAAHYDWEFAITTQSKFSIKASRGHGKSHIGTFVHALWFAATVPGSSFYIFSGTDSAAQRMLEDIKVEIEQNPKLRWLFPQGKGGKWSAAQIRMSNGSQIGAKGMLTRSRGIHPHRIIVDDGQTDEDMWSATKRAKTKEFFFGTITNMLLPGGVLGSLGTPMAADDLLADLDANAAYWSGTYPALDADNKSTWPQVYSTDFLLRLEKEIGSVRFSRERRCVPVSDESSLFPLSLFHQGETMQPMTRLGAPLDYWKSIGVNHVYIGVDFAFSASVAADYFVIVVLGVDGSGNRWLMDMHRAKGVSFSEQKSQIVSYGRRYEPRLLLLESNAAQQVAADELRRQTDLPIKKFVTTSAKHSLVEGLPSLRILLENNKFRIPRGDARSIEMSDVLINEATNFTWQGGKAHSVAGHDDVIMACFAPGAMVSTVNGARPIEEIGTGELVLTHRGRYRAVVHVMKRKYKGNAYRFKRYGMPSFITTPEHPILTCGTKYSSSKHYIPDEEWRFNEARLMPRDEAKKRTFALSPSRPADETHASPPPFDLLAFTNPNAPWKFDQKTLWYRKNETMSRFLSVDGEMAFFLGLYLAQGSTSGGRLHRSEPGRTFKRRRTVEVAFHSSQTEAIDWVLSFWRKRLQREGYAVRQPALCTVAKVSCTPLAEMLHGLGTARNKHAKESWMSWPIDLKLEVLRGWLFGDGFVDRHVLGIIGGTSYSRRLAYQMMNIWHSCGFAPRMKRQLIRRSNTLCYTPTLTPADTVSFMKITRWRVFEKERWKDAGTGLSKHKTQHTVADGVAFRLKSQGELELDGDVFNLQVSEDESYVVEGVSVHNCYIADRAIARGSRVVVDTGPDDSASRLTQNASVLGDAQVARSIVASSGTTAPPKGRIVMRHGVPVRVD